MAKYLDGTGLSTAFGLIKNWVTANFLSDVSYNSTSKKIQKTKNGNTSDVVTLATVATSGSYNDLSNKPTIPSGVSPYDSDPEMDGTASPGSSTLFARGDHVHPTDTSRAASSHTHGNITNGGDITATAPTISSGDKLIINDESASKITNGPSFGTDTTKYLRNDGTWAKPTDTTYNDFTGATSSAAGTHGLVPAPASTSTKKVLISDGAWHKLVLATNTNNVTGENLNLVINCAEEGGTQTELTKTVLYTASQSLSGLMSATDKTKLDGIASGAEVNVQSDWNQSNSSADDYIKNKPTIPTVPGDFTGATSSAAGAHGLVPAPGSGKQKSLLWGNGTWDEIAMSFGRNASDGLYLNWYGAGDLTNRISWTKVPDATTSLPGAMSATDKTKLDSIATGAEVNVQSNWTQTNSSADDYIKNKPTLGAAAAKNIGSVTDGNTDLVTGDAVYDAIQDALSDVAGALVYKGTAATASAISGTSYKKGWYWIASDTFALTSSINVEPGDMIIAKQDKTSTFANDIDVVQTNIETLTTAEVTALWNAA